MADAEPTDCPKCLVFYGPGYKGVCMCDARSSAYCRDCKEYVDVVDGKFVEHGCPGSQPTVKE